MTAQAVARAREFALTDLHRSRPAGGWSSWYSPKASCLDLSAAVVGGLFSWWAGPFVVSRINPRIAQCACISQWIGVWRLFGIALTFAVMFLFGLIPLCARSSVKPASALQGGDDPHSRGRLMHALVAAQVAFCFIIHFCSRIIRSHV